ncbi:DUF1365 domain-containing protein [Pseudooceanicola sp. CBS1P-1]|uniref:DUF1365 family protein n=1 Tax=Pseudooceanicola albus TaxID=2692189 RepID=A0A6L7G878_9RHOB|nr:MULTISPECIES: DUF1365 domain-containing protein [Pseudooceanicola]MBT9384163.1 DUF1365 domain-containing protein [Pseudooceanicola endophyticus]MXN19738.1 DUF1365 family protein [Pseudooceanicola albus]
MTLPRHIPGQTLHARRGAVRHRFRYSVDYVLIDPEDDAPLPLLFSRNRINLASVHDRDHGGIRGQGRGAAWLREALRDRGLPAARITRIGLLTQPAFLGRVFNPVSFWLVWERAALIAVVAEVNNTFGDRHSYLCAHPGFLPIGPTERMRAQKVFHVSPFQDIAGGYSFRFDVSQERVSIHIDHDNGREGLYATLTGPSRPLTNRGLLAAALRRPTGTLRVLLLIYWQALKLKAKGARYRTRPTPPEEELS